MKVRKQTSVAVLNHTDGEYQRTSCKNKPSRTAEFDSMCAKLEENFSPEGPDGTTAAESLKLNKKLVGTLLAKSFEQELVGNADLKKPIDTLSVRMQTLASLFILPEKEDQAKKQETIIRGFFGEDIKFTHDSKNTGAYNPENDGDAFYQYRNYAYDKSGNEGKIIGNKPGDRNFLNNSHPFYALSLIMNLHYVGHEVPMVGESNKGVKQNTSTIAKILTVPFIKHHLFKTNYGARDSRMEPHASVAKDVFGTFTAPNEITLAEAMGLSTKEAPSEFFQETGWKSVKSSYKPKSGNAYNENATKKDYYVAGASGATVGILCAHVRLASFEKYLQNDGHVSNEKIDRHALHTDLLNLSMSLYAWMGLAGDHSFYEVAFSHAFMDLYCDRFMNDEGKLRPASEDEVSAMIGEIQKQDFMTNFLSKVYDAHPQAINKVLDKLAKAEI